MRKRIIDDHTIKVFITQDDLKQNGITALDLLGDHNQIEAFFYKILDKVDTKHLFMPHEPLTFRVLPNQRGLDIIISCPTKHEPIHKMRPVNPGGKAITNHQSINDKVIELNNFEDFIQIAHILKLDHVTSKLYQYKHKYYLELNFNYDIARSQLDRIKNLVSVAYEYGDPTNITSQQLQTHGKVIMKSRALEKGRYYFH